MGRFDLWTLIVFLVLCCSGGAEEPYSRIWTDVEGREILATYISDDEKSVTIRNDGKPLTMQIADLCEADQEYLRRSHYPPLLSENEIAGNGLIDVPFTTKQKAPDTESLVKLHYQVSTTERGSIHNFLIRAQGDYPKMRQDVFYQDHLRRLHIVRYPVTKIEGVNLRLIGFRFAAKKDEGASDMFEVFDAKGNHRKLPDGFPEGFFKDGIGQWTSGKGPPSESPTKKRETSSSTSFNRKVKELGMPLKMSGIVVHVAKRTEGAKISWGWSPSIHDGKVGFYLSPPMDIEGGTYKGDLKAAGYLPGNSLTTKEGPKKGFAIYNLINTKKQTSEMVWPSAGDSREWTKSKATARITRIVKGRNRSGAGKETAIEVDITIPAQREEFWITAYIQANAYIDGKPVVLRGSSKMDRRWSNRKFYMESHVHFPEIDKIVGISVMLFDKDNLLLDSKTKGKFKPIEEGRLPIVKSTGNGHVKCYTK